ncbi:MAG: efflux RND transporter periplasmic adaptor subunit, partial [bacterium]
MKKVITVIIIVIVIAAGSYYLLIRKKNGNNKAPVYTEAKPTRGEISQKVAASGSITSNLDVEIKCKASGEITTLPFDISQTVNEGDLLLELDPVDEQRNVELAKVNLFNSQARLKSARENLNISELNLATARERAKVDLEVAQARADTVKTSTERTIQLYNDGFISKGEYEQALTDKIAADSAVDSARIKFTELDTQETSLELLRQDVVTASSNVDTSQINLDLVNQRLDDTRVYSPMAGVITDRYVQIGQIIASGISNTGGGTSIMKISDLSRLFVLALVDESDIGHIVVGQQVKISVDAFPTEKFEGTVDRIAPTGVNVSNVVTFDVRIEVISDNKTLLMPEMTADVEIITAIHENAITVPLKAVQTKNGEKILMVQGPDGKPESRTVVTGID